MRDDIDMDALKARLLARKQEIVAAAEEAEETLRPVEPDQGRLGNLSRMGELQEYEMARAVYRREQAELKRIEAALARMKHDEYGYCVSCGNEIGPARLKADPSVPTCIDCASRAVS